MLCGFTAAVCASISVSETDYGIATLMAFLALNCFLQAAKNENPPRP